METGKMNISIGDTSTGGAQKTMGRNALLDFFVRLVKEKPLGTVGGAIVLLLLITGIFADQLAPYGYNEAFLLDSLTPPSNKYWLGTDDLGRDLLSRVIYGARISMIVGVCCSVFSTVISALIGIVSGYLGGKFDLGIQRIVDAWMAFPGLILLMSFMALVGTGLTQIIIILSIGYGVSGSRIVRSAVIGIKENVYVRAAQTVGCSFSRILLRHILPNVMAPIIILVTVRMADVILTEAALSFLGFGIPPPMPSWGGMLSGQGRSYMLAAPWMVIWPGLALSIAVYGINMFGDALRDLLDPRQRGGGGTYSMKRKKS
jgi:peptide/nickel transport system permease protein